MTRLQLRIAAILIGAVTLVVVLSTLAAFVAMTYPNPERMIGPVASQIRALVGHFGPGPRAIDLTDVEVAQLGEERRDLTDAITARLAMNDVDLAVRVFDSPVRDTQVAVVELDGRNVAIEFPGNPPPPLDLWRVLGTWMGLVIVGIIIVSLIMAYRVTRPFTVLERAVLSVGPDGVLPRVPEQGSREAVETAVVLNRLSQRLRIAMESRMRLLAAAGHDFRTPLTRMRLRAEFLRDEERAAWLKDVDELERIADSAIHLVQEEVSDSPAELVALDQMLSDEVRDLASQGYALRLAALDPATVWLPPLAMRRALRNLLINAATHGRGGTAELYNDGTSAIVRITDSGPGIPEELLERVFEPFFRAEPGRGQTVPGAGLGLAIAREIVERAGAKLRLRNSEQGGLLQDLTVPLHADKTVT